MRRMMMAALMALSACGEYQPLNSLESENLSESKATRTVMGITATIEYPALGIEVGVNQDITLTGTASSADGIKEVHFYVDGAWYCVDRSAPYECPYRTPSTPGSHTILMKALNNANSSSEPSSTFNVVALSTPTPTPTPVPTPTPAPPPTSVTVLTVSGAGFSPASIASGGTTTMSAYLTNPTSMIAHVKLAVYANNVFLFQQDFFNQSFAANTPKLFQVPYTQSNAGTYTLAVTVNKADWSGQLLWAPGVATLTVGSVTAPTPTPPPTVGKTTGGVPLPTGWSLKQSDRFGTSGNVANASQLFAKYYEGLWYNVDFATTVEGSSGRQIFPPRGGTYIDGEQQWYTHFEDTRVFNFKSDRLTIQARGQADGTILSGKMVSKYTSRSFCVEAKFTIPNRLYAFPAFWQYANSGHYGQNDQSAGP